MGGEDGEEGLLHWIGILGRGGTVIRVGGSRSNNDRRLGRRWGRLGIRSVMTLLRILEYYYSDKD